MSFRAVLRAGVAALIPATVVSTMATAATEMVATAFRPPSEPLILIRSVYRPLADGNEIIVTRRYRIQFTPEGQDFRLDGELVGTDVSAPSDLAALAEIERNRPDRGLFPAMLGPDGMIRGQLAGVTDPNTRRIAFDSAKAMIAKAPISRESKAESSQYLGEIAKPSTGTAWPRFLFNPGQAEHREAREVALPDGSTGQIEVRVRAEGLMPGGLARRVERTITTRLAGTERTTREVWTLAP